MATKVTINSKFSEEETKKKLRKALLDFKMLKLSLMETCESVSAAIDEIKKLIKD